MTMLFQQQKTVKKEKIAPGQKVMVIRPDNIDFGENFFGCLNEITSEYNAIHSSPGSNITKKSCDAEGNLFPT